MAYVPGRLPSVKTLVAFFGRQLAHDGKDPVKTAREVRRVMQESRTSDDALQALDKIMGTYGVETTVQHPYGYPVGRSFRYLNTGESYAATIIRYDGRWILGTWGDFLEALERRGIKFD